MPRKAVKGFVLAVSLCGWAVAAEGRGQSHLFLEPDAGAQLEPGTTVQVTWRLEDESAAKFDEMELLLSLDGGRSFPVRVTRDLSRAARRLFWRVPALPTNHARLALRTGSDEKSESETIQIVGPEFSIAARRENSLEVLFRVAGEWRTREARTSAADFPEPGLLDSPTEEMRSGPAMDRALAPPRSAPPIGGGQHSAGAIRVTAPAKKIDLPPRDPVPVSLPLRQ